MSLIILLLYIYMYMYRQGLYVPRDSSLLVIFLFFLFFYISDYYFPNSLFTF